ncbi:MAG: tRNA (N6-threonylcarbamoyladenosine(37)-N6)-methyltransferase TrmO [Desulfobacterales bacterium]|nr:tRNA (N6-threonylcarbamoyladenosine(37)-N6)-methyltransferase TrmO [Desulfobacterales bacterium]
MELKIHSIGVAHTPFNDPEGMPIQPRGAKDVTGTIVLDKAYEKGLADLDGFSHIIVLFHLHRSKGYDLMVTPFLDDQKRGLFSTRAPRRPNPIGLSVVRLLGIKGNTLTIQGVDMLNKTPIIDIKPFVPLFDTNEDTGEELRLGWLEEAQNKASEKRSDKRFIKD